MQILARIIHEPQNIEVKSIVSLISKTSAVRNSLFDIRYSDFDPSVIQAAEVDSRLVEELPVAGNV
jgi:hypothetical protein